MWRSIFLLMALTTVMSIHVFFHESTTVNVTQLRIVQFKKHNEYRAKHGVPRLQINDTLNTIAQIYAEKLAAFNVSGRSIEARRYLYGENIFEGLGKPIYAYKLGEASDAWYSESRLYDYEHVWTIDDHYYKDFTAMIWKSVKTVGFGYASSQDKNGNTNVYVVANYYPTPNWIGQYQDNVPPPL